METTISQVKSEFYATVGSNLRQNDDLKQMAKIVLLRVTQMRLVKHVHHPSEEMSIEVASLRFTPCVSNK